MITSFLGFGSQLLVVKFLTLTEIANIKTLQSFITISGVMAAFGFGASTLKLCSEKRIDEDKFYILNRSFYYSLVPITITMTVIFVAAQFGLFSPVSEVNHWMMIYMFMLPASVLGSLFFAYLQALKKIKLMSKMQVAVRLVGVVILVAATYLFKFPGYIFSVILIGIVGFIPLWLLVKNDFRSGKKHKHTVEKVVYYAKWSFAANLVNQISIYIDIFIMNYLVSDRNAMGYYSVAAIFFVGLTQITSTIQSIATPYFSEKSNDKTEFLRTLKKYQKIMVWGSLVVSVAAIAFIPVFIRIIYGENYSSAGDYSILLSIRYFIVSCYALIGVAIVGLGMMKFNFYSSVIASFISIPINYLFIRWMGVSGAAYAQIISCLCILIVMLIMMKRVIIIHFDKENPAVDPLPE